jgi:hypothetical protein
VRSVTKLGAITLIAMLLALAAATSQAATIMTFSQYGTADIVSAVANVAGTATTISVVNGPVVIGSIDASVIPPLTAFLSLVANSDDAAIRVGKVLLQNYTGSFSITSGPNGTGTNYLSGTFDDEVTGKSSSLSLVASDPDDDVAFSSSVIDSSQLQQPDAISFSFTNVTPPATLNNQTLASFVANISGNFSADPPVVVSEPASALLFGVGLIGVGLIRRRRHA